MAGHPTALPASRHGDEPDRPANRAQRRMTRRGTPRPAGRRATGAVGISGAPGAATPRRAPAPASSAGSAVSAYRAGPAGSAASAPASPPGSASIRSSCAASSSCVAVLGAPFVLVYAIAWLLLPDTDGEIHLERLTRGIVDPAVVGIAVMGVIGFIPLVQGGWLGWRWWPEWPYIADRSSASTSVARCACSGPGGSSPRVIVLVVWLARRCGARPPRAAAGRSRERLPRRHRHRPGDIPPSPPHRRRPRARPRAPMPASIARMAGAGTRRGAGRPCRMAPDSRATPMRAAQAARRGPENHTRTPRRRSTAEGRGRPATRRAAPATAGRAPPTCSPCSALGPRRRLDRRDLGARRCRTRAATCPGRPRGRDARCWRSAWSWPRSGGVAPAVLAFVTPPRSHAVAMLRAVVRAAGPLSVPPRDQHPLDRSHRATCSRSATRYVTAIADLDAVRDAPT